MVDEGDFKRIPNVLIIISKTIMGYDPAHGWPHVIRVLKIARRIAEEIRGKIDWLVLETAIALHDIGRNLPGSDHHAIKSAVFAEEVLPSLGYDKGSVEAIVHAIRSHSYSLGESAETVEAKILSDADKIDALGAVGIARVIHTGCQLHRSFKESLLHFYEKILNLPSLMYLDVSKRIAEERISIIQSFVKELEKELD